MKHLRGDVFGIGAIADAAQHIDVHSVKVAVVQVEKPRGIGTRGVNEGLFVGLVWCRDHVLS